jgi:hypothetical protein
MFVATSIAYASVLSTLDFGSVFASVPGSDFGSDSG